MRLVPRVLGALLLSAVPCAVVSSPAEAQAAPWRFATITSQQVPVGPSATQTVNVGCPPNYVIVGGGFTTTNEPVIERVWDYKSSPTTYSVRIHNYSGITLLATAYAVCALGSHVGTITTIGQDFAANGSGIAGGTVSCPAGQEALWGGADWNDPSAPNRRLDGSAPNITGNGWVASGWTSNVGDSLHVEAYCIATSELGGVFAPQSSTLEAGSNWFTTSICPQGQRVVSGGAMAAAGGGPNPATDALSVGQSRPDGPQVWRLGGHTVGGSSLYIAVWCIPASAPTLEFTSTPPKKSTSAISTFTFDAGDPVGEELVVVECRLDGDIQTVNQTSCRNGSVSVTANTGHHTFQVVVTNASGQTIAKSYVWDVDSSPPVAVLTDHGSLVGPFEITFTEDVTGVDSTSVWLELELSGTKVPGTLKVVTPRKISWTARQPLIAGQEYLFRLTDAIQDSFGNPVFPDGLPFLALPDVPATDPGVVQRWDIDKAKAASGGAWATSRLKGSSLSWTFKTSAGQSATVFGLRQPKGGKAAIFLDGGKVGTRSFYAAKSKHGQELFKTGPLSSGNHTLEVRVLGTKDTKAKGTWVALDRLRVAGANRQESAAVHRFRSVSAAGATGGAYATVDHATKGDTGGAPSYSLTFKSNRVVVYATRTASSGKARIIVDGTVVETIDLRSEATEHQVPVMTVGGLTDEVHTLRVVPVGTGNGAGSHVGIDRFDSTAAPP